MFGRTVVAVAALSTVLAAAGTASANPWPWPTITVGETRTLPAPEQPCTGDWQIDFGAPAVAIVQSTPSAVTVRGLAASDGPLKLRCASTRPTATGPQPFEQSLWLQVLPAAPAPVVPEVPFTVLTPVVFAGSVAAWFARDRRRATRLRAG
jgi:hypothetical protein